MILSKSARNERKKLSATFVNGLAIALVAVGGFAPIVGAAQNGFPSFTSVLLLAVCLLGAGVYISRGGHY